MNELNLDNLNMLVAKGLELQKLLHDSPEILEYLRLIRDVDTEKGTSAIGSDRLVRAGEAAKILCVKKETIYRYAMEKILTPMYTADSTHMKFWLSEVKSVARRARKEDVNGNFD